MTDPARASGRVRKRHGTDTEARHACQATERARLHGHRTMGLRGAANRAMERRITRRHNQANKWRDERRAARLIPLILTPETQ